MTMEDFIQKAVELQSHSVDITTYWLKATEAEYLTSLRHLAFRRGDRHRDVKCYECASA